MNIEPRIAIIGGGITGLAAAQRINEKQPKARLELFEASSRLGGVIQTTDQDGFLFEHSADNFIVTDELPWARQLCEKLNVPLIPTNEQHRGALILRGKQFHPVPEGLQLLSVRQLFSLLKSPLLSWAGKLRVANELFVPRKTDDREESLQEFTTRRFGREMFERIVQPLVSGIYTADPAKLSISATLPQFVKQEEEFGSLIRAARAAQSDVKDRGARYSLFHAPEGGMQSMIDALQRCLPANAIHTNSKIKRLARAETWQLSVDDREEEFDGVLCATSATRLSDLLAISSSELAVAVDAIEHASTAVVCLGYHRSQISHPLNAFGCIIPSIENKKLLAISFTSIKFPARAPRDHVLVRAFVGGALQPEVVNRPDDELLRLVQCELTELLGVSGEPVTSMIVRWPSTTPQYHLGHRQRVQDIERAVASLPSFELAGNAYYGIGIPQCIRSGWNAADRLIEALGSKDASGLHSNIG